MVESHTASQQQSWDPKSGSPDVYTPLPRTAQWEEEWKKSPLASGVLPKKKNPGFYLLMDPL